MRQRQRENQWRECSFLSGAVYNKQLRQTDRETPRLDSVGVKLSQENNGFTLFFFYCLTQIMTRAKLLLNAVKLLLGKEGL